MTPTQHLMNTYADFCLPENLLWAENSDTKEKMAVIPGEHRATYVQVGHHIPNSRDSIEWH